MARLLIECTRTAVSGLHTGIQRVVRRLIAEAQSLAPHAGWDAVVPVVIDGERLRALPALPPHPRETAGANTAAGAAASPLPELTASAALTPSQLSQLSQLPLVAIDDDDHLLLVDAAWHLDAWPALRHACDSGAQLHVVWHDLIPLQHPEFFPEGLPARFRSHLDQVIRHTHSIQCVSATVRAQLADYLHRTAPERIGEITLGVQHPGADGPQPGSVVRAGLRALAGEGAGTRAAPMLLTVGTIEPRKGHALLLDACESLWRDADAGRLPLWQAPVLCIAGSAGWRVDSLLARLAQHPERGRRLFVFHDLSDAELDWCYRHAWCLVYPSLAEGYGLPIAEAGWRGLPVLLSDTPIHREVAGPRARYFAPQSAAALEAALRGLLSGVQGFDRHWPEPGRFRRWRDSTAGLIAGLRQRTWEEG